MMPPQVSLHHHLPWRSFFLVVLFVSLLIFLVFFLVNKEANITTASVW